MKLIAVPILMFLLITQIFSKYFVMLSFQLNRDYIAKNLCENRYRPQLHCKGNCVLMKKIKQEQKQEQNAPGPGKTDHSILQLILIISSAEIRNWIRNVNRVSLGIEK